MRPLDDSSAFAIRRLAALPAGPHQADRCWRCGGPPSEPIAKKRPSRPVCDLCAWAMVCKALWPRRAAKALAEG